MDDSVWFTSLLQMWKVDLLLALCHIRNEITARQPQLQPVQAVLHTGCAT